jgi:hypothetical protein
MTNMNCTTAREEMLIADLADLRGEGSSELAAHLRTCTECRAVAATLVRSQGVMNEGLAALKPRAPAKVGVIRKPIAWRWAPLPLAAAAVLALLLARPQSNNTLPNIDAITQRMFREAPVFAPPAGKQAMVIEKNNMTIVWLYNEEKL